MEDQSDHSSPSANRVLLVLITCDWYVASHRLDLLREAVFQGWRVVVATHVREHRAILEATGAEVRHVRWWRADSGGPTQRPLPLLRDLRHLMHEIRPTVVHCVALRPVVFGAIVARFMRVPVIVTALAGQGFVFVSSSPIAVLLRPLIVRALRTALSPSRHSAAMTILQNPDDAKLLVARGVLRPEGYVIIRGAGVDLEHFHAGPEPTGVPLVVLPGRMLWEKGIREFVEAVLALRAGGVQARFALVGPTQSGNARFASEAQLAEWERVAGVEWWGARDDMPDVLDSASLVVLPSYGEGLPKALLEAAACGRAIVATDVPGCREIVQHEVNGLLVPARDSVSLADAMRRLLDNPEERHRMGREGRDLAEREFGVHEVVRRTLDVYAGLLGGPLR